MLKGFGVSLYTSFTGQCPRLGAASPLSTVTPLFPLSETQHFQGLSSSMAPFYTKVWLLSALLSVIVSWVIKQNSHRVLEVISSHFPPSLHPNTAFLLAAALLAVLTTTHFRASHICHTVSQMQALLPITSPSSSHLPNTVQMFGQAQESCISHIVREWAKT